MVIKMKYCANCGKKNPYKYEDNCHYCGYPINREFLNKNLLEEKIDRFYRDYIENRSFSLEKKIRDEEHNYHLLPIILYISFVFFLGFYTIIAFLFWLVFSKEKNILELLIFCFPFIYVNLNLFTISSSIKKNREKAEVNGSNIKEWILDRLQLKWNGSIDSLECYNKSYLFFGFSSVFLFILYIPFYEPIVQVIILLVLSLIIDYIIFKLDIFGPKTKIYNDSLLIKKHDSRKYEVIKWADIESVRVVFDRSELGWSFFKFNLKNNEKPIKISFNINKDEILEIKKIFIAFMSLTTNENLDKNAITRINKSVDNVF